MMGPSIRGVQIEGFNRDLIGTVVELEGGRFEVVDIILYPEKFGEIDAPFVRMVPLDRRDPLDAIQVHFNDFQALRREVA